MLKIGTQSKPGLPQSEKNILKMIFFQVREKTGKFVDGREIWKGHGKSGKRQGI